MENDAGEFSIVFTTTNTQASAQDIAAALLRERLAACIQIVQVQSHYVWQDRVCNEPEHQLQIKARTSQFDRICTFLDTIHPYETPEIVRVDITAAAPAYAAWMRDVTGGGA